MRVVVLGAGGLLGRHLVEELRRDTAVELVALGRADCDITNADTVRDKLAGAQLVFNCAAFTDVDGAERDEQSAYRINALGAGYVAGAAEAVGARLAHVSTDFVFDGTQPQPYDEFNRPNPQSVYARSKWAGEELAKSRCRSLFVVRVQGLYGAGGRNFSSKLRRFILDGKTLTLDGERRVQPTWARTAARQLVAIGRSDAFGTYHVSCKGEATWAAFAARLAQRLEVAPQWRVVRSDELGAPAPRPSNCLFQHRMLAMHGLDCMPTWDAAQDEYLSEESR